MPAGNPIDLILDGACIAIDVDNEKIIPRNFTHAASRISFQVCRSIGRIRCFVQTMNIYSTGVIGPGMNSEEICPSTPFGSAAW